MWAHYATIHSFDAWLTHALTHALGRGLPHPKRATRQGAAVRCRASAALGFDNPLSVEPFDRVFFALFDQPAVLRFRVAPSDFRGASSIGLLTPDRLSER
jgi:hypothetical protein